MNMQVGCSKDLLVENCSKHVFFQKQGLFLLIAYVKVENCFPF